MSSLLQIKDNKISINNNTLKQIKNITNPIKVISIIGEARHGKSTYLNCFLSQLKGENQKIFVASSMTDHCTKGINCYIYNNNKKTIIFLDCQGIQHEDSSNDLKLLLFTYLVSNIMIFNSSNVLNNTCLKNLEPVVSFCNLVDIDNIKKPKLFFRIKDYSLDEDIDKLLKKTLKPRNDQYDGIREALNNNFESLHAVSTEHLDRSEIRNLKDENYRNILNSNNGFIESITTIISHLDESKPINNFCELLTISANSINNNKKVDFKKLDTYSSIIVNDVNEFMLAIDKSIYQKVTIDGLQETYDNELKTKLIQYHNILINYKKKFMKEHKNIFNKYLEKLKNEIYLPLKEQEEKFIEFGIKELLSKLITLFDSEYKEKLETYFDITNDNCHNDVTKFLITLMQDFSEKYSEIYYQKSFDSVMESIYSWKDQIRKKQLYFIKNYNKTREEYISAHDKKIKSIMKFKTMSEEYFNIHENYENQPFRKQIADTFIDYFNKFDNSPYKCNRRSILLDITDKGELLSNIKITDEIQLSSVKRLEYNKVNYYLSKINNLFENKERLYNKIKLPYINKIIGNYNYININPNIKTNSNNYNSIKKMFSNNKDINGFILKLDITSSLYLITSNYFLQNTKENKLISASHLLLEHDFEKFIDSIFMATDIKLTKDFLISLFSEENDNPENLKTLNFNLPDIHSMYEIEKNLFEMYLYKQQIIKKVTDYHYNRIYDSMI